MGFHDEKTDIEGAWQVRKEDFVINFFFDSPINRDLRFTPTGLSGSGCIFYGRFYFLDSPVFDDIGVA